MIRVLYTWMARDFLLFFLTALLFRGQYPYSRATSILALKIIAFITTTYTTTPIITPIQFIRLMRSKLNEGEYKPTFINYTLYISRARASNPTGNRTPKRKGELPICARHAAHPISLCEDSQSNDAVSTHVSFLSLAKISRHHKKKKVRPRVEFMGGRIPENFSSSYRLDHPRVSVTTSS